MNEKKKNFFGTINLQVDIKKEEFDEEGNKKIENQT